MKGKLTDLQRPETGLVGEPDPAPSTEAAVTILDAHLPASAPRNPLRGGFSWARDPHGGFLVYSPAGICFAWVEALPEADVKVAREIREGLWT